VTYEAELRFLEQILKKCRLQVLHPADDAPADSRVDLGLRRLLGNEAGYREGTFSLLQRTQPKVIYRLRDEFLCSYLFFRLPGTRELFLMGPYLVEEPRWDQMAEQLERLGVHPRFSSLLERYYAGLPVLGDQNPVYAAVNAFGERIWGGPDEFTVFDVNRELSDLFVGAFTGSVSAAEETSASMRLMEQRYAAENELMQAISRGQLQRVNVLMNAFSARTVENRAADPVRNLKNYCIIMNTLARKAAEQGGVAPLYLDQQSSAYARRIESINSVAAGGELMGEMLRSYCRLVRRYANRRYSAPVEKTVLTIDADLSGDLSLRRLAKIQGINASYLSSRFRQETGKTLTDYVTQRRMELAGRLLATTSLQVQTVAQRCGMGDVNYFSKLFKKETGFSPREYRLRLKAGGLAESRRTDRPGD